ncbi:dTDP-4-dehydrorhamnose reductase [Cognatishimia sp. 1_MG-2023]|uniref:dTDP-4-dehydrorhamnose reductase n=1 Tax=Cognatishimia sp. 1_MG-2023 TaxID=3062642 RepID=UPI0026E39922|nr:dTDP-4-dehydrorhamnose reductase [Cognatishimia sp. 1_MG-2023]MDO6728367.1 dTDP-4-dehydrorhamnose reductase [Cognatishimia sp. 1_MG-2023]
MKTLVFGKTGQVATELRRQADVIALGRDDADLSDPAACVAAIKTAQPDVVINAAAYTAVDKAEDQEELASIVNGKAPAAMAKVCADMDIPFVHISTDYVFDGSGEVAWRPDDATNPLGAYGRSKLIGEQSVQTAGGRYAILRTSWVFSAHGNNFVKTMLRLGETRNALTVVADQIGGPTAAADIAAACLRIADQLKAGKGASGVYHFAGAPNASWADFARAIFEQAKLDVKVTDIPSADYPTSAKRPLNSRMDCARLETEFGVVRPFWRDSLAAVLTELKDTSS